MAVQLSITQEQAKLLLLLLQMVTSQSSAHSTMQKQVELPFQPIYSSTPDSSMDLDSSQLMFNTEELRTKVKKNTDAQNLLRVSS